MLVGLPTPAFTVGWLRPRIYVAPEIAAALSSDELAAVLPTALMFMFGKDEFRLSVDCTAKLEISNVDVMLVLDVTGSMAGCCCLLILAMDAGGAWPFYQARTELAYGEFLRRARRDDGVLDGFELGARGGLAGAELDPPAARGGARPRHRLHG